MSITLSILLAGATLTGPAHTPAPEVVVSRTSVQPATSLSAAVSAAAARHALAPASSASLHTAAVRRAAPTRRRYSLATRVTAVFAGTLMGSVVGMTCGGLVDVLAHNQEGFPAAAVGLPIGAAIGGVLTAVVVQ